MRTVLVFRYAVLIATATATTIALAGSQAEREGRGATNASSSDSRPFDLRWRVLLNAEAASQLIRYCGELEGTESGVWNPSEGDLDLLEQTLLPLLAADLVSEGSLHLPHEYYRQYAAARWRDQQIIYVNGFHRSYVERHESSVGYSAWTSRPVIVMDGGASYWCAIYIKDSRRFITIKEEGRPSRTVAFHGYA